MAKFINVYVTLKNDDRVATEISEAILMRANPHASQLVEDRLEKAGITVENLSKYVEQVSQIVCEFWQADYDKMFKPTLRSHEVRNLYLPLIMSVVYSQVGNISIGQYTYRLKASTDVKVEKEWVLTFSATLENNRDIILGDVGQIGNYAAQPQTQVMLSILGEMASDGRTAEMLVRDGTNVDEALAGLSALAGLALVDETYRILYTGVFEANFRQVIRTLVQTNSGQR
jgi:hypothetical protein